MLCSQSGHRAKNCRTVDNYENRKAKLRNLNRCHKCLKNHKGSCYAQIRCSTCNKDNHNEIFCFRNFNKSYNSDENAKVDKETKTNINSKVSSVVQSRSCKDYKSSNHCLSISIKVKI